MSWEILGENGKNLSGQAHTLGSLNISAASLKVYSLAEDGLNWRAEMENATGDGTTIPSIGQVVELWRGGTRYFRGHVTVPRVTLKEVYVSVAGPWWWMNNITLSQIQNDGEGTPGERASYVFPTQNLRITFETLIDRLIENGVPVTRGVVDEMFDFPRITLTERSGAQALADLMAIVPDAVAWIDYTVEGLPSLNITRRGNMEELNLTVGEDLIEDLDLYPRLSQEVSSVTVQGTARNPTTGKTQWTTQASGVITPGKNQIITVSGPEPAAFLPKDKYDQVDIKSLAIPTNGVALGSITTSTAHSSYVISGDLRDFVLANDPVIATMVREFGYTFYNWLWLTNGGRFLSSLYTTGSTSGANSVFLDRPNLVCKTDPSGFYLVISPTKIPEWATLENGYIVKEATLTSYLRWTDQNSTAPSWWDEGSRRAFYTAVGYPVGTSSSAGNYQRVLAFESSIPVQIISTDFPTLTTVYRQWDYDYAFPPAGLADGLLAAQNWLPWEGQIQMVEEDFTGTSELAKRTNVANSLTECASMGALTNGVVYDLITQRKTLTLGPPARSDFGTLAARFRGHPKDNITYL